MFTGFKPSVDELKALRSLGAKETTSFQECSHLVAAKFARTEKFLCAIGTCSYIVRSNWFHDSIEAGAFVGRVHIPDAGRESKPIFVQRINAPLDFELQMRANM
jgi:hypothetical protein